MQDDTGAVTLPGFYEGVPELTDEIRSQWQRLNFDHAKFLSDVGLKAPAGEQDRTPLEMIWSRPTCDVNGIWGGYTGDGFKTVLPSQASAKLSFRLVGTQDPDAIRATFRSYLEDNLPDGFSVEYRTEKGAAASQMSIADPAFEKARQALSDEWPRQAAYVGCGGSIPVAGYFKDILGMDDFEQKVSSVIRDAVLGGGFSGVATAGSSTSMAGVSGTIPKISAAALSISISTGTCRMKTSTVIN